MDSKHFLISVGVRLALMIITVFVFVFLIIMPGYHASTIVVSIAFCAQVYNLFQTVSASNTQLLRFLQAAEHADYSARFVSVHAKSKNKGNQQSELNHTFERILQRFQAARQADKEKLRHLESLVEHVPVPLLSVLENQNITLWNHAARNLFNGAAVLKFNDLSQFGDQVCPQLLEIEAGERRVLTLQLGAKNSQLIVSSADLLVAGKRERLLCLQDIQSELDASQLEAWQDLVKVLTHEIMNSITPIASLANTAVDLVEDSKHCVEQDIVLSTEEQIANKQEISERLNDVLSAVTTVARRSESLINFVDSYRKLTQLPQPNKTKFLVSALFDQVLSVTAQLDTQAPIKLTQSIETKDLSLHADAAMLEQVLINLLKNASQAVANTEAAHISLRACINKDGELIIEVADNGSGIDTQIKEKMFIPFYTTKREGSGVGLALARQVMNAHRGIISHYENEWGGATFKLLFN